MTCPPEIIDDPHFLSPVDSERRGRNQLARAWPSVPPESTQDRPGSPSRSGPRAYYRLTARGHVLDADQKPDKIDRVTHHANEGDDQWTPS